MHQILEEVKYCVVYLNIISAGIKEKNVIDI